MIGYIDGKPQWSENEPAYAARMRLGGSLVVGEPAGPVTSEADRQSSRRYREAHPERVSEAQRKYRAKVRAEVDSLREERAS